MNSKQNYLKLGLIIALAIILTACGGSPADTDDSTDSSAGGGIFGNGEAQNLGRERSSAAGLQYGSGEDICDRYEKPILEPFSAGNANALAVLPNEHTIGIENAPVSIVMYADLLCSECAATIIQVRAIIEKYPDTVSVTFRHFPTVDDANSVSHRAAQLTESAAAHGGNEAFWDMIILLSENQAEWAPLTDSSFLSVAASYAEEIGLDPAEVIDDLNGGKFETVVSFSYRSAIETSSLTSNPMMIVNDLPLGQMPSTFEFFDAFVQLAVIRASYVEAPPMVLDPENKDYVAWLTTENGIIAVNLFADLAPETVNNIAYLSCMGYYDDVTFHRVLPGFVAQTGDPSGTGFGGPNYTIPDEFALSGLLFDRAGLLSMAKSSAPNSARSQFFITLGPASHLDGAFTIFGEVVVGIEVAEQIAPRDPQTALDPGDLLFSLIVREIDRP